MVGITTKEVIVLIVRQLVSKYFNTLRHFL